MATSAFVWVLDGRYRRVDYVIANDDSAAQFDVTLRVGEVDHSVGTLTPGQRVRGTLWCGVADHWFLRFRSSAASQPETVFLDGVYLLDRASTVSVEFRRQGLVSRTLAPPPLTGR